MKQFAPLLASFTLLLFAGCAHLPLDPLLGQGQNGGVFSVTYKPCASQGKSGAVRCVIATASDALHKTTWQVRKYNTTIWGPKNPKGMTVTLACNGMPYVDYEVLFTPPHPDVFRNNNPSIVRIYPDRLATVKYHYYR